MILKWVNWLNFQTNKTKCRG